MEVENQAQRDPSSTFSGRGSETLSIFDPNLDYDSNSVLGACLFCFVVFHAFNPCHIISSIQRTTLPILKFAQP